MMQEHLLKKIDLASLKSAVDTLDINELKSLPDMTKTIAIDLKKLSDIVDRDVAKDSA